MSARIIARANRMFSRAASIMAKAQALLNTASGEDEEVEAPVRKVRAAKVVEAPVKKARRAQVEEAPVRATRAKKVLEAPAKKTRRAAVDVDEAPVRKVRTAKSVDVPVKKGPAARKAKAAELEVVANKRAPKNVKIQVEDDFPDL